MGKRNRKRPHHHTSPPPLPPHRQDHHHHNNNNNNNNKKPHHHSSTPNPPIHHQQLQLQPQPQHQQQQSQHHQLGKRPTFTSYLETPHLLPKIKILCEIIASTPSSTVEKVLEDTGIRVVQNDVEDVLKLSYGFPGPAVKFFRWSGHQLNDDHSPYGWNLVVDMLGKNCLFDAMWDAIKSMKKEGLLSLATFASVFSSYVAANRVGEAIMTFEVMDQYGVPRDIIALNSLLSAICRDGKVANAVDFLRIAKDKIRPDADTYAILLEGWENEGDVANARISFGEMVLDIGWDPGNVPAYDSYLNTLLKGPDGMHEALKVFELMNDRRCYPGMKFFRAAINECVKSGDGRGARLLWDAMVGTNGCRPDTDLYNSMVALYCYHDNADFAKRLVDEMVYEGAFPDTLTYNLLFQFLIKSKKLGDASAIFNEMVKNECIPSQSNCRAAIMSNLDIGSPYMAIRVWKCMIENYDTELEETGNLLVMGLRDSNMLPEAVKYAEDMIERGIKLNSSTLSRLKQTLCKVGKPFVYDELLRKWKSH